MSITLEAPRVRRKSYGVVSVPGTAVQARPRRLRTECIPVGDSDNHGMRDGFVCPPDAGTDIKQAQM